MTREVLRTSVHEALHILTLQDGSKFETYVLEAHNPRPLEIHHHVTFEAARGVHAEIMERLLADDEIFTKAVLD